MKKLYILIIITLLSTNLHSQCFCVGGTEDGKPTNNPTQKTNCINGGGLVCPTLPIELLSFNVNNTDNKNTIVWSTATETNNNYFIIERSTDADVWETISTVNGNTNSNTITTYHFIDESYTNTLNYYRLSQVDLNGDMESFNIITINNIPVKKVLVKIVNMMGQEVGINHKGMKIFIYKDGTRIKKI